MRGITLRAIALSCLLIVSCGVASRGQNASPDWTIENFRWTGPLAPAAGVQVLNSHGDVRVRAADAGEVEVSAMIQRRASEPSSAEVKVGRRRGRLTIEVVYPAASRSKLRRVDLAVFLPAGAPLTVRTRDGMIDARGLAGDVALESTGGNITLRLPADADARVKIRASEISLPSRARVERRTARRAIVTLGQGTHSHSLETRKGSVTLLTP